MKVKSLHPARLRQWFSNRFDRPLNSFLEAVDDEFFQQFLDSDNLLDVRLTGDEGRPFLPDVRQLFYSPDGGGFGDQSLEGQADTIVLPGVVQRVEDPFKLLRAIYPLLKTEGSLIISVPLRDIFEGKYQPTSYHAPATHKRFYTISSLFLELQAAWGFNAFRIRFAKEYDGLPYDHGISDAYAFSLVMVVTKRRARSVYPDFPLRTIEKSAVISNRSEEEAVVDVDLSGALSPRPALGDLKTICLLKLDHIGDFVMSLPVFDELRAMFPTAEITCICGGWNVSLANDLGCFDHVLSCNYYALDRGGRENTLEGRTIAAHRLGKMLAGRVFDLAIDLRVASDSRRLLESVPARLRAGIGSAEEFPFLDIALPNLEAFQRGLQVDPDVIEMALPAEIFSSRGAIDSPAGVKLIRPPADDHKFIFGPYMPLKRGAYRLNWLISTSGERIRLDVDASLYDRASDQVEVLNSTTIEVDEAGAHGMLEFELHADATKIEFRAQLPREHAGAMVVFAGCRLESISGRPTIRAMPRAQVHMKEQMSLLLALVRNRLVSSARPVADIRRRLGVRETVAEIPFFVFVPLSNSELRNWPIEGFIALGRLILSETTASVRLIGSPGQRDLLQQIAVAIAGDDGEERVVNAAGESWTDVYTGLVQAEAVISNNSGMAHVAAMLGGRVLALFSASHQVLEWGPIGPEVRTLQASLPCGACGFDTLRECLHGHRCMQIITPPGVLASLRNLAPRTFVDTKLPKSQFAGS
jgi:ADP-heptose:LPS heptosyltransferase/SAM-dependent methyltransferase